MLGYLFFESGSIRLYFSIRLVLEFLNDLVVEVGIVRLFDFFLNWWVRF